MSFEQVKEFFLAAGAADRLLELPQSSATVELAAKAIGCQMCIRDRPKRHLDNIIEMIYALDKVAPGTANYDTLLYGVEVKFYSSRIELTRELETARRNLFACGDGAGVTRGLSQAAASEMCIRDRSGKACSDESCIA